jgi:uracil-DNA glycosylase
MADSYQQLLDATIQHLQLLQTRGVRHVSVSPDALARLAQKRRSAPKIPLGRPASARTTPLPAKASPAPSAHVAAASPVSGTPAKLAAFAELRQRVLACVKCPNLVASRKNVVFGVGNLDADLMFVGEAPGADEDEQGEPFVGRAGQLLTKIIEAMGLQRQNVYIANILKCRPDTPEQPSGNRRPTAAEIEKCIPYLHEQIDLIQPKVIVALGATAVEGLLHRTGISQFRGYWQSYRGIPLMPTFHPSYLLRKEALGKKRLVWEDMLQVMEKLGMPISARQRNYFLKSAA